MRQMSVFPSNFRTRPWEVQTGLWLSCRDAPGLCSEELLRYDPGTALPSRAGPLPALSAQLQVLTQEAGSAAPLLSIFGAIFSALLIFYCSSCLAIQVLNSDQQRLLNLPTLQLICSIMHILNACFPVFKSC